MHKTRIKLHAKLKPRHSTHLPENTKTWSPEGCYVGWFFDPCWRANIHLIWPATPAIITAYLKRALGVDYPERPPFAGKCVQVLAPDGRATVQVICLEKWDGSPKAHATLAHECFHAAEQVLDKRGLTHSDATSEPYAYLLDSFVWRSLEILNQPDRPRRHVHFQAPQRGRQK